MKQTKNLIKYFFFFSIISLIFASCSKDEPEVENPKNPEDDIEYYVKYESMMSITYSKEVVVTVRFVTEDGTKTMNVPTHWEGVFGPFKELTRLELSAETDLLFNPNMTSCRGRISICRGNQPFILKEDKSFSGTRFTVKYDVQKSDLK